MCLELIVSSLRLFFSSCLGLVFGVQNLLTQINNLLLKTLFIVFVVSI